MNPKRRGSHIHAQPICEAVRQTCQGGVSPATQGRERVQIFPQRARRGKVVYRAVWPTPELVASPLYLIFNIAFSQDLDRAQLFPVWLLYSSVIAGVPTIIFTAILELAFAKGLKVESWWTLLLGSGLGFVSGVAISSFVVACFGAQRMHSSALPKWYWQVVVPLIYF